MVPTVSPIRAATSEAEKDRTLQDKDNIRAAELQYKHAFIKPAMDQHLFKQRKQKHGLFNAGIVASMDVAFDEDANAHSPPPPDAAVAAARRAARQAVQEAYPTIDDIVHPLSAREKARPRTAAPPSSSDANGNSNVAVPVPPLLLPRERNDYRQTPVSARLSSPRAIFAAAAEDETRRPPNARPHTASATRGTEAACHQQQRHESPTQKNIQNGARNKVVEFKGLYEANGLALKGLHRDIGPGQPLVYGSKERLQTNPSEAEEDAAIAMFGHNKNRNIRFHRKAEISSGRAQEGRRRGGRKKGEDDDSDDENQYNSIIG